MMIPHSASSRGSPGMRIPHSASSRGSPGMMIPHSANTIEAPQQLGRGLHAQMQSPPGAGIACTDAIPARGVWSARVNPRGVITHSASSRGSPGILRLRLLCPHCLRRSESNLLGRSRHWGLTLLASGPFTFSRASGEGVTWGDLLRKRGWDIEELDILRPKGHDLSDPDFSGKVLQGVSAGRYQLVLLAPPCDTCTRVKFANQLGPKPSRSYANRRGFPLLKAGKVKRAVQIANYLYDFSFQCLKEQQGRVQAWRLWNSLRTWARWPQGSGLA
jgi:hypothetical protein